MEEVLDGGRTGEREERKRGSKQAGYPGLRTPRTVLWLLQTFTPKNTSDKLPLFYS